MKCENCAQQIEAGEENEHLGRVLCEDCYMDALSPAKTCDPWAVYSAKNIENSNMSTAEVTPKQREILDLLKKTGGVPREELPKLLGLTPQSAQREIAPLRHMEKVRGELRDGRAYIVLF